jgi:sulfur carrier protein
MGTKWKDSGKTHWRPVDREPLLITLWTMIVQVNGEQIALPGPMTVLGLIQHLQLDGPVAVERNQEVVPRAEHPSVQLAEGDHIEIVHFVGGG